MLNQWYRPPDWQARAGAEALDEQRRNPRPYPDSDRERRIDEREACWVYVEDDKKGRANAD